MALKRYEIKHIDGEPYIIKNAEDMCGFDIQAIKLESYLHKYMLIDSTTLDKYGCIPTAKGHRGATIDGLINAIRNDILSQGYIEHESRD